MIDIEQLDPKLRPAYERLCRTLAENLAAYWRALPPEKQAEAIERYEAKKRRGEAA